MKKNLPYITIVIPLFNEEEFIGECLNSLLSVEYPKEEYEIIVVDNGSLDGSIEIVKSFNVKLFNLPGVKVGAVRNFGVSVSSKKSDYLAFLDADCTVEPDWLVTGVNELSNFDAVGGLVKLRERPSWIEKYWLLNDSTPTVYQNSFIGANIFIKRDVFEAIGGFDESLNAGEDSQLTFQLAKKGYKTKIFTKLNVTHLGYPTTVKQFVDRQRWHSSDYINNLRSITRDKVLFLVMTYIFLFLLMIVFTFVNIKISIYILSIFLFIPVVFSVKRLNRYGGLKKGYSLFLIYIVDTLYLIGRSIGFFNGVLVKIVNRNKREIKISKKNNI